MSMRPYQVEAINQIRNEFSSGRKKVLLKLATGGGKTHIFCDILKRTAANGKRCSIIVRGRQLVDQASQRLTREGVQHGVRMAGHWNKNYSALVQVCSIDTLIARNDFPESELIVIDEAHLFTSEKCKEFIAHYNHSNVYILSVTATPYTKESLEHMGDTVVQPISITELIDHGYLVPPRYFAPSTPDLRGVTTRNGDFVVDQLAERMRVLTGDIVQHWNRISDGRPTICFAVNIKHSLSIVEQFKNAGIPAEHIEGDHSFEERKAAIARLESGEIKVLSNVGILCTGVDIPFASAILMARPTKSYNLYIQQAGRGTRISPETGKRDFIVLDHAGNTLRHGLITDEPEVCLEGVKILEKETTYSVCESCYAVYQGTVCHACGAAKAGGKEPSKEIELEDGILEELRGLPQASEISLFIRRKKEFAKRKGYDPRWVYHAVKEQYGEDVARQAYPSRRNSTPWFLRRK